MKKLKIFENDANDIKCVGDLKSKIPSMYSYLNEEFDTNDSESVTAKDFNGTTIVFVKVDGWLSAFAVAEGLLEYQEIDVSVDRFMDELVNSGGGGNNAIILKSFGFEDTYAF